MTRETSQVLSPAERGQLEDPPHVMAQLVSMMVGGGQPAPSEMDQLITHLVECSACLEAFHNLIALLEKEDDQQDETFVKFLKSLAGRIDRIRQRIQARNSQKVNDEASTPV